MLCDCWGHTAGSRLGVFARKPAPVQTAWINFLPDHDLASRQIKTTCRTRRPTVRPTPFTRRPVHRDPVAGRRRCSRTFRAGAGRLPPTPTPRSLQGRPRHLRLVQPPGQAQPRGHVDVWAAVMRSATGRSVLLLKCTATYADPVMQRATLAQFAARAALQPERIQSSRATAPAEEPTTAPSPGVDVMLDSWPAPGSTTTLDALSNGVPVLSDGRRSAQCRRRSTPAPSWRPVGLHDLAATSPEAFVGIQPWRSPPTRPTWTSPPRPGAARPSTPAPSATRRASHRRSWRRPTRQDVSERWPRRSAAPPRPLRLRRPESRSLHSHCATHLGRIAAGEVASSTDEPAARCRPSA